MLAARLHGARDLRLEEIDEPIVRPGTVKVQVAWNGICGSDLVLYSHDPFPADTPHPLLDGSGPHTLGHELSGTVVDVGAGVDESWIGRAVAVRPNVWDGTCPACRRAEPNLCAQGGFLGIHGGGGGYGRFVVVGADQAHVLPEGVSLEAGAMVESTAVAWHAARLSGVAAGGSALVVGGGPIGLGLVQCLKALGVATVIVSEISGSRRALAAELGADVVDPRDGDIDSDIREATGGHGVDVSFDAAGAGSVTFGTAVAALRSGGTAVVLAHYADQVTLDTNAVLTAEKRIVGSFAYRDEDFREVIDRIAAGDLQPTRLITARIGLQHIVERGIEHLLSEGRDTGVKILVSPDHA